MKGVAVVMLALAVAAVTGSAISRSAAPSSRSRPNACTSPSGLAPHPADCNKYYFCLTGVDSIILTCPGDMYFNRVTNVCEDRNNVVCPNPDACTSLTGMTPHPADCKMYHFCMTGLNFAIVMECPGSLYFNPVSLYCDYAQNVACAIDELI